MKVNGQQIAEMVEAAYRRGYQQGYTDGLDMVETVDLSRWRRETPLDIAYPPQLGQKPLGTALSRLWIENGLSFEYRLLPSAED